MPKIPIKKITARQILDSRGEPTLEVTVETKSSTGIFGVPSGVSTGKAEAFELRDQGPEFNGMGVSKAVAHVNDIIHKKIRGMDVLNQAKLDQALKELDGTQNKSRLGANAIVGVSGACCKAAAAAEKIEVYEHISQLYKGKKRHGQMPKPMFNFMNGGKHGDTNMDIQEFMIVPTSQTIFGSIRVASEIFHSLKKVLMSRRLSTNLGNEGGYSPHVEANRQALDFVIEAGKLAGYEKGKDFNVALDAAASSFYKEHENHYTLMADKTSLSSERMVSLLKEWVTNYSIISIEDGLSEEDWGGWLNMTERLGRQIMLVGDDLFVTNEARLKKGIEMKVANAVIIKPNQVGTITEAMDTAMLAREHNYKVIASHRSGETNDDFIADFAVGIGADFIKAGSVARGERVAKYNRLLKIEQELG